MDPVTRRREEWSVNCRQCGGAFRPTSSKGVVYCKECSPNRTAYDRIRGYGVDQVMFDAMYFEQDGACAICKINEATDLDHDHETGAPRGILCHPCNKAIGFFNDDVNAIERAITYLEESKK